MGVDLQPLKSPDTETESANIDQTRNVTTPEYGIAPIPVCAGFAGAIGTAIGGVSLMS